MPHASSHAPHKHRVVCVCVKGGRGGARQGGAQQGGVPSRPPLSSKRRTSAPTACRGPPRGRSPRCCSRPSPAQRGNHRGVAPASSHAGWGARGRARRRQQLQHWDPSPVLPAYTLTHQPQFSSLITAPRSAQPPTESGQGGAGGPKHRPGHCMRPLPTHSSPTTPAPHLSTPPHSTTTTPQPPTS
jgi:hypothetical protein